MPSIIRKKMTQPHSTHKSVKAVEISKLYNSQNWINLRNAKLMANPLCEMCLAKGKTTPAEEVHHITPISTGDTELQRRFLAYDPNNVMSLCKKCHHMLHTELKKQSHFDEEDSFI